ncbi:DUF6357 family protein [Kitasatospora sp. NPDC057500]|uniref:DUF6357 family protein n=1 Tax=Kitasatospora sp. NPDC057500 TaxID=3346151 RepID=UPI0036904AD4
MTPPPAPAPAPAGARRPGCRSVRTPPPHTPPPPDGARQDPPGPAAHAHVPDPAEDAVRTVSFLTRSQAADRSRNTPTDDEEAAGHRTDTAQVRACARPPGGSAFALRRAASNRSEPAASRSGGRAERLPKWLAGAPGDR